MPWGRPWGFGGAAQFKTISLDVKTAQTLLGCAVVFSVFFVFCEKDRMFAVPMAGIGGLYSMWLWLNRGAFLGLLLGRFR